MITLNKFWLVIYFTICVSDKPINIDYICTTTKANKIRDLAVIEFKKGEDHGVKNSLWIT